MAKFFPFELLKAKPLHSIFILGVILVFISMDLFMRQENVISNNWKRPTLAAVKPAVLFQKQVKRIHKTTDVLKILERKGYPLIFDPWKSYIKKFSSNGSHVYKGPIVNGWPPEKDRYLQHYIRSKTS